jgi:hypothetical protein
MTQSRMLLGSLLTAFSALMCGCGTGEDRDGAGNETFIPDLPQKAFHNRDNPDDKFFFLQDSEAVHAASFTGNENNETIPTNFSFSGAFVGRSIHLTYDAASGAKAGLAYSGTIEGDSTKISLSGPGGPLILIGP